MDRLSDQYGVEFLAKMEGYNPGGSIKDRTAMSLLEDAEQQGRIHSDTIVIEATSGNTGIALAMFCASKNLRLVIFMPAGQSIERKQLFWAYGAAVIETPQEERTQGAVVRARAFAERLPNGLMLRQHENPANPAIHERTTAPEIWEQTHHKLDVFISGVGTGGTVTGSGRFFRTLSRPIEMVAVEPKASAVLSGNPPGAHKIQGIGAGFVPEVFDRSAVDRIIPVADEDAWEACEWLARNEGVLVGISSGAVYAAAKALIAGGDYKGKTIVGIFADSGERYLSTGLFKPPHIEWVESLGLKPAEE